jgi:hypothetical protein
VGILLSVLLVVLLPVGDPLSARAGRRAAGVGRLSPRNGDASFSPNVVAGYACDLGATLAGVALGSAVASRVVALLATRDAGNPGEFALQVQDTARSVGVAVGVGELILVLAVAVASRRLSRLNSVTSRAGGQSAHHLPGINARVTRPSRRCAACCSTASLS